MRFALVLPLAVFVAAGEVKLGKPLTLNHQTSLEKIYSTPEKFTGKLVQVKGRVTEVCQMMGCWMALVEGERSIRIKVADGVIEFPKDAAGKVARAEGRLEKLELTRDQAVARARHEAEEQGRKFDSSSVKGPVTVYHIAGTGAVIDAQ
jgi:hypothetical protein